MNEDAIERLKLDNDFIEFQEYIASEIEELDSVEGLGKMSNEEAGEEAKVRLKTKQKLFDILSPFLAHRKKQEPTTAELQNTKKKYGF